MKTLVQQQRNNIKHKFSGRRNNDQTSYVNHDANSSWAHV